MTATPPRNRPNPARGSNASGAPSVSSRQRRAAERAAAERKREVRRLVIVGAVAVLAAGALALATNLGASGLLGRGNEPVVYATDGETKGDPNAPVTVTTWDDFQ